MNKILLILLLSGCANQPMSPYEKLWQTTHLIDTIQTMKIAKSPCHFERNKFLGKFPKQHEVLIWGSAYGYAHYRASTYIENSDWPSWIKKTLAVVDIGIAIDDITGNYNLGIHLGAKNSCPKSHS